MKFHTALLLIGLALVYNHFHPGLLNQHAVRSSYASYDRYEYTRRHYSRIPTTMPDVDRNAPEEPNRNLTPGATLPVSVSDLCVRGYTKTVRSVSAGMRRRVFAEYGLINYRGGFELDHDISLELGGSNSIQNLWPETKHSLWNAYVKDRLENRLHNLVCDGQMPLAEAQREIATDWIASYKRWIAPTPQHESGTYED